MSVIFVCFKVPKINAMHCVSLHKLDPSYMVSKMLSIALTCVVTLDRRRYGGVVFVTSLFLTRVRVYVRVFMCMYTHNTHTHCTWGTVSPRFGTRHLESMENQDGLDLGIYVFVYVYKVHMCIYMLGGGMRLVVIAFFL